MSILRANLKHLYQRRIFWLWYLVILCQVPLLLVPFFSPKINRYLGCLVISFLVGLVLASLHKEILAKPFSYCLPGHRQVPRRFLFWIGGIVNAALGLVFLAYPGLGIPYALLVVSAAGFAGMLVYFWGMYVGFLEKPSAIAGISIPLVVLGAVFFELDRAVQYIIVSWPPLMIAAGALTCIWVWKWLGRDSLHRRYCGKLIITGSFDNWNRKRVQRLVLAQGDTKYTKIRANMLEGVDRFFLTRIAKHNMLSRPRHIFTAAYILLGKVLAIYRLRSLLGVLLLVLFFLLYFGYMPLQKMASLLYIFCAFPLIGFNLLPHPTLLLPAGRVEKYHRAIASAAIATLVGALLLIALTALSLSLENTLPAITFMGSTFTYHTVDIRQFYSYLLFVPIALALTIVFPRNILWRIISLVVLMQLWATFTFAEELTQIVAIGPTPVCGFVLLVWVLFLLLLRYYCMSKPLVGQTRQY